MLKTKYLLCGLVVAGFLSAVTGFAQNTNSADLSGSVTDARGGLIPGATVTVRDVDKATERTFVTDKAGLYDTGSIVPDHYLITITAPGFKTLVRGPINLDVGTQTLNAQLPIGAVSEQVVVTTDLPLLDTSDGSQTDTLSSDTMAALPQYGADWENFVNLLPGAAFSYRAGQSTSINGNLPYSSILADGATTTLPMSTNADVTVFESTAEVKVDTNAFSAQYGIGGIIFNQITKSGDAHFHGSAYEYLQNNALNAADYAFGHGGKVPFQRYDNYGFSVSGPVPVFGLKNKLFFFFDWDKTYSNGGSGNQTLTVPTDAMKTGDFTGMPVLYDNSTQSLTFDSKGAPVLVRQSYASEYGNGNKIPTNLQSQVAKNIAAYYPEPNVTGSATVNAFGEPHNNYFVNVPNLAPFTKYVGRLDYSPVASHRFTISETESDNPAVGYGNGQQLCPVNCQYQDVSRDNAQVSDVWTISPNMVNEARFGFTDQLNFFSPFSLNEGIPAKLGWQFAKANTFPGGINFNSGMLGLDSSSNAVYKEFVFDPSDVVTLIRGRHVLHFGGEFLISRADSTAWGNLNSGTMQFSGDYTDSTIGTNVPVSGNPPTGYDYADFVEGYAQKWSAQNNPEWGGRLKNPQLFLQDDYKIRPNLTLNLGVRWTGTTGWSEVKGNIVAFDPSVVNPATNVFGVANTLGAAWYAFSHANGRTHLQAPVWTTILPRFGFSYSPNSPTVVRGGIGLYNYTWSDDTYGNGIGNAFGQSGSENDSSNGIYPVVQLDSTGDVNNQQQYGKSINSLYLNAPTSPAAFNGQGMNYNQYHTPIPKIWQWNLTVQRQLGTGMMAQLAYVGSHGFNLFFPMDLNQVPESKLSVNDASGLTNARPYPLFQGLGGSTNNGISNYHSMQAVFQKRMSHGLEFTLNYTWSHFLVDNDSSGWGSSSGTDNWQQSYCVHCNYGASNFDQRQVFTATGIYTLPFGRGRAFLNKNVLEDEVVGGWRLSMTTRDNTGVPFSVSVNGDNNSYSQAGTWYPNQIGDPKAGAGHSVENWFNKDAFAIPTAATFGDAHRNSLYGPGYTNLNLSFGKTFEVLEKYRLEIRADAQNALNHPSFSNPDSSIGNGNPAQITGVTDGGRHIQIYAHFSF